MDTYMMVMGWILLDGGLAGGVLCAILELRRGEKRREYWRRMRDG